MVKETIKQSRGFLKIEAEILEDGVRYSQKGILSASERKIRFELIPDDLTRAFHVNRLYLFISLFFAFLLIFRLFRFLTTDEVSLGSLAISVAWFVVSAGGTWMQSPQYIGYVMNNEVLLFFDHKGNQNPLPFLEKVQQAKYRYFNQRYGRSAFRDNN